MGSNSSSPFFLGRGRRLQGATHYDVAHEVIVDDSGLDQEALMARAASLADGSSDAQAALTAGLADLGVTISGVTQLQPPQAFADEAPVMSDGNFGHAYDLESAIEQAAAARLARLAAAVARKQTRKQSAPVAIGGAQAGGGGGIGRGAQAGSCGCGSGGGSSPPR